MKSVVNASRFCAYFSVSALALFLTNNTAIAQNVTPLVPLSDVCQPQSGSQCIEPVRGTRSFTIIKPAVITNLPNGDIRLVGETEATFDGRLQVDGVALTGASVFPTVLLPALNEQLNIQVATRYDTAYDFTYNPFFDRTIFDPSTKFTVKSLQTKSIGVDIKSDAFTFADGSVGKLRLASLDPTAIVNDATAIAGKFSSTDGKIVFGTITGQARIVKNPAPITLDNPFGDPATFGSPLALAFDVTSTVQTQLDETGLITPKVAVSQGIEMNDSKITGLAAGTQATDAVNYSQLQSEAAKRAAIGDALLDETKARIAGDMALSNQLGALESRVSTLSSRIDRQDAKIASSTAIAVAMGGAVFLPGMKYNLTANVGTYQGAHAGSIQFGALVSRHVAVNAGVATGFNKGGKTAGRVGFTLGW